MKGRDDARAAAARVAAACEKLQEAFDEAIALLHEQIAKAEAGIFEPALDDGGREYLMSIVSKQRLDMASPAFRMFLTKEQRREWRRLADRFERAIEKVN